MKRLLFVIVFLAVWTVTSIAVAQTLTPFETIKEWYANGEAMTPEEVRGAYAGRCYTTYDRKNPHGALLIIDSVNSPLNGGPAFPAAEPLKLWFEVGTPKSFNNLSVASVEATMTNMWQMMTPVIELFGTVTAAAPQDRSKWVSIKKSAQYLVALYEPVQTVSRAEPAVACYFFKKLK